MGRNKPPRSGAETWSEPPSNSIVPELRGLPPTEPSTTWQAHEDAITSARLSPDGKFLATAGQDSTFKVWSAGSWSLLHNVPVDAFRISHLRWSHNSRYIAFANEDDKIEVWDLQNQQRVHVFSPNARIMSITWNPNGHHLYAATDDGHISIWHLALGRQSGRLLGHQDAVNAVLFVHDQEWLISGGQDPSIRLWNVNNKQLQKALCQVPAPTYAMALSPKGDTLATGHADGSIYLHSFPQGKHIAVLPGHKGTIRSLSFSPNGTWLASASHDGHIKLWDTTQSTEITDLNYHQNPVHSIDIHVTGRWMISAANESELCVWDVSRL